MPDQVPAGDSLLRTKLRLPRLRPQLVVRQRLLDRLQNGIWCRLALICAQAGFGKTTLLVEWARQSGRPVAWITLDEGDNASERFLRYLHAAFQSALPGVGAATASGCAAGWTQPGRPGSASCRFHLRITSPC